MKTTATDNKDEFVEMKLGDFLDKYSTKTAHGNGAKMMLDGKQYLIVCGPDSEAGQKASAEKYRIDPTSNDIPEQLKRIYASLVIGWSFTERLDVDLVVQLFDEYPHVYDRLISFFQTRVNFTQGR